MTFKKNRARLRATASYVLRRRQAWFDAQPDLKPERLVSLTTGASTKWPGVTGGRHGASVAKHRS